MAAANCIQDVELLASIEFGDNRACTEIGEIQLEYLKDRQFFPVDNFDEKYGDYVSSRSAFTLLHSELLFASKYEGYTPNIRGILNTFQASIFSTLLLGNLEGKRGALYFMAFMEISNKYGRESNLGTPEIFKVFSEIGEFDFRFDGQALKLLSMCFWEFDIPTLPVEAVLDSEAIAKCMAGS